jgi:hypothetical protein
MNADGASQPAHASAQVAQVIGALERLVETSRAVLALIDGRRPQPAAAAEAQARLAALTAEAERLVRESPTGEPAERARIARLAGEAQRLNALARARAGELAQAASFGIGRARAARAIVAARKSASGETGRACDVRA